MWSYITPYHRGKGSAAKPSLQRWSFSLGSTSYAKTPVYELDTVLLGYSPFSRTCLITGNQKSIALNLMRICSSGWPCPRVFFGIFTAPVGCILMPSVPFCSQKQGPREAWSASNVYQGKEVNRDWSKCFEDSQLRQQLHNSVHNRRLSGLESISLDSHQKLQLSTSVSVISYVEEACKSSKLGHIRSSNTELPDSKNKNDPTWGRTS